MTDNNVIKLAQPGTFIDLLSMILRSDARALLTQAVEAEVAHFLHRHCGLKTDTGRRRVVRHGHRRERDVAFLHDQDPQRTSESPMDPGH